MPVAVIVAFPQPVEHTLAGAGELGLFVVRQRVGADDRDAPPTVEDRLGGGEVVLGAGAGCGLGELGLELRALLGRQLGEVRPGPRGQTVRSSSSPWSSHQYHAGPPSGSYRRADSSGMTGSLVLGCAAARAVATYQPTGRGDLPGHLEVLAVASALERAAEETQAQPVPNQAEATSADRGGSGEHNLRGRHGRSIEAGHGG